MFRCYSYTIIRERINLCLLKLQLVKKKKLRDKVIPLQARCGPQGG